MLALRGELERLGTVLVSSGGVDSALLAVIARSVLGDRMACGFLDGPLIPRTALEETRAIAAANGLPLSVVHYDPIEIPAVAGNPRDRCYHCTTAIAPVLKRGVAAPGLGTVVDGANCSDPARFRPGIAACGEEGVEYPFVAAGIAKPEIRTIARSLGLSFAEKPSAACLASCIPWGEPLIRALLWMVEDAEEALRRARPEWRSPPSRCR